MATKINQWSLRYSFWCILVFNPSKAGSTNLKEIVRRSLEIEWFWSSSYFPWQRLYYQLENLFVLSRFLNSIIYHSYTLILPGEQDTLNLGEQRFFNLNPKLWGDPSIYSCFYYSSPWYHVKRNQRHHRHHRKKLLLDTFQVFVAPWMDCQLMQTNLHTSIMHLLMYRTAWPGSPILKQIRSILEF